MRKYWFLFWVNLLVLGATAQKQPRREEISVGFRQSPILPVLKSIEQSTRLRFAYNREDLDPNLRVSLQKQNRTLAKLFAELSEQTQLDFIRIENLVAIKPKSFLLEANRLPEISTTVSRNISNVQIHVTNEASLPLGGVSVRLTTSTRGGITDANGSYTFTDLPRFGNLLVSCVGFQSKEIFIEGKSKINIVLTENQLLLKDVVVVGSRSPVVRSHTETAAPIDVFSGADLLRTGQTDLGQMLAYLAPSFHSTRNTISDGTDHIDPATLRGLGPDQVLVLINGKRRHTSALVNVNSTIGRGSVGTDLNTLPITAIERIEILRDGAAAQYGSDAIAGVVNIVLKEGKSTNQVIAQTGITHAGDGFSATTAFNKNVPLGKKGGFVQFAAELRYRGATNRSGLYDGLVYLQTPPNATSDELARLRAADEALVLQRGFNRRTLILGNSQSFNKNLFFNAVLPISTKWEAYFFGGSNHRQGKSAGFYRYPNNPRNSNLTLYPDGYLPFIISDISDHSLAGGFRTKKNSGWEMNLSSVAGVNIIAFEVENSLNASLGNTSPTRFYAGQLAFLQLTNNITLSRSFPHLLGMQTFNLAMGAENRVERYYIGEGELASYQDGNSVLVSSPSWKIPGSQVFPGFRPVNAVRGQRSNLAFYTDIEADLTDAFLVSGAFRVEHYTDFGSNITWRINNRLRLGRGWVIRAGVNRGFRAPSLHQQYFSSIATQFITVGGVNQQREVLTLRNDAPLVQVLGVPALRAENSLNASAGITAQLPNNINFTLDAYQITITNRIVMSGRFSSLLPQIMPFSGGAGVTEFQFFTNAIDTRTRGIDVVFNWKKRRWNFAFASNFNQTKVQAIRSPGKLAALNETLFNREEVGRVERNQPQSKLMATVIHKAPRWQTTLRFTRFGSITTQAPQDPAQDQRFNPKIVTDIAFNYSLTKKLGVVLGANNLLNVYPDRVKDPRLTNANTVIYSRFATQFGFNGRFVFLNANLAF